MSDPFDAPAVDEPSSAAILWIRASQAVLAFTGLCYVVLGLGMGGMYAMLVLIDPTDPELIVMAIFGVIITVLCVGIGVLNFVAIIGLQRQTMWGWIMTLIFGAMYAPSGCMPFGLVLLFGMLNNDTRPLFLKS